MIENEHDNDELRRRVADVECRYAELELLVEDLNTVIYEQATALDELRAELKALRALASTDGADGAGGADGSDQPTRSMSVGSTGANTPGIMDSAASMISAGLADAS